MREAGHRAIVLASVLVSFVMMWPGRADAQDARIVRQLPPAPLSDVLPDLILREITLDSPAAPAGIPGLPPGFTHTAHFSPIEASDLDNPVVRIVQAFNTQLATQFSTFPLGSSSGGLTYFFDEAVGTLRRNSSSYGPLFGERALTLGRGKMNAGLNYQHTAYDTFEGQHLNDGSIKFYLRHEDCCTVRLTENPPGFVLLPQPNGTRLNTPFESDLIEAALSVRARTNTIAVFGNYGLTNHWDIGVAVPFVRVSLEASVTARILRLVTASNPTVHAFDVNNPNATLTINESGHAAGVGDIVVRTKYRFVDAARGGLAATIDLRLPTGDDKNLLGTGGVETKLLLVASDERGRFGHHVNGGYTLTRGDVAGTIPGLERTALPDEIHYAGGVDFAATPRLTLNADVVGRTLRGAGRLNVVSKEFVYVDVSQPPVSPGCENSGFACKSINFDEFAPQSGNLTLVLGAAGMKYNVFGNLLLSASVLWPLSDAGLRSRWSAVAGLDYAF
jgi:Putative MetA-pathway of phenol degradation